MQKISPEEWELAKIEMGKQKVIKLERELGQEEGQAQAKVIMAKNAIKEGFDNDLIAKLTGLNAMHIQAIREELNQQK